MEAHSTESAARIHRLAELNTEHIGALDRDRTAVLIPGGILEEFLIGRRLTIGERGWRCEPSTNTHE